jgi:hypothetical protein
MREVNGRPRAEWTDEERAFFRKEKDEQPLMWAGHVGISFDGGETIYGMTPDTGALTRDEAIDRLKAHEAFPGKVQKDTEIFRRAERNAQLGWNTELVRSVELVDPAFKQQVQAQVNEGRAPFGYSFPLRPDEAHPVSGQHYAASNGYAPDQIANCAIYPARLGIEVPEASGNLEEYIPALKAWSEEAGPKDFRSKETP